jgi:hypothetical protein
MPIRDKRMREMINERMWPVLMSVWATFLLYGFVAATVPAVNEPHYLCKSKNFWQPDWCDRDFFLASPNAHTVFYATIGSLTRFVSLTQAAVIGRILVTLVLAWGWTRCLSQMFFTPWSVLWSAWVFLIFSACGNFSGEWLVGGVEGKVLCYGFLLAALGDALNRRFILAATWAGLAVSFHPVVGLWGLLAFILSSIIELVIEANRRKRRQMPLTSLREEQTHQKAISTADTELVTQSSLVSYLVPCVILISLALPGLVPVFQLLTESVSPETRRAATYIQVYYRLAHHLDPMWFPLRSYVGYALLVFVWLCSCRWGGRTMGKKRLDHIVFWSVMFAVAGILIGWGPRPPIRMPFYDQRMNLLKFYPFRLADVLMPVVVAISLVGVLERTAFKSTSPTTWRGFISHPLWILTLIFIAGLCRAHWSAETNRYSREDRADWLDVCAWIDNHLPSDALVQTPTNGWAFKWFARRAEYVAFKDCPQDAVGIVEWNTRLNFLQRWFEKNYEDELYSADELKSLRQSTGLTHLLTDRLGPVELEPIYRNATFQVYDLTSLDSSAN